MNEKFNKPDFRERPIELRCEGDEVSIYGTREGLDNLILLCQTLLEKNKPDHIHLEDHAILTKSSLSGVIVLCD